MNTLSSDCRFDFNYYRLQTAALPHQCILPFTQHAVICQLKKELQQQIAKTNKTNKKIPNGNRWIAGKIE